jgi:hypothetical protein
MQIKKESTKHLPPPTVVQYQEAREAIRERIAQSFTFYPCRTCGWPVYADKECGFCGDNNKEEKKKQPDSFFMRAVVNLRNMSNEEVQKLWDNAANDPECSSPHIRFCESEPYTMKDWSIELYCEVSRREFLYKQV